MTLLLVTIIDNMESLTVQDITVQKAAAQFGRGEQIVEPLGEGLIHRTYKVTFEPGKTSIVLQCINQNTFPQPENIINNYRTIYHYLQHQEAIRIPELVLTLHGKLFWRDEEGNFWRALQFVPNSFSPSFPRHAEDAFISARCFGQFTNALSGLESNQLDVIIPGFHDLAWRYRQFEEAVSNAHIKRLLKSTHLIAEIRQRKSLVDFYEHITTNPSFKKRVMHHDCKISNVLFDKTTRDVLCPVDLDTVMPGLFFSDVGDMVRTMSSNVDENSTRWEDIAIKKDFYESIVKGYMEGIGTVFTAEENEHLHKAGLIMIYMQCIRFVADFLNNDIYYKTTYPEQNLNRGLNQFILLERLEEFVGSR